MVHLDGFDITKEILYYHVGLAYRRRGISLLIVDHPGVGEALRLRNLFMRHDTEVPAGACVDYLEGRPDVDPERIGVVGPSLGSYYAPRAAAFEKRFKCCVAWGGGGWGMRDRPAGAPSSVPSHHLLFVTGKDTVEEANELRSKLTLEGAIDKITCPLLVVAGEADRLTQGIAGAERSIVEAINSPQRRLKVFSTAEGAVEHCGVDNVTMQIDYMSDWVAEILGGNPKGA
jgi:dienelactone hydrolase